MGDNGYSFGVTDTSVAVGPASDGTWYSPVQSAAPVDAGGGAAGNYGQSILDVFKFGVGAWQQQQNQSAMLDYRRWEATSQGIMQQGIAAQQLGVQKSNSSLLIIGGLALVAVLVLRG